MEDFLFCNNLYDPIDLGNTKLASMSYCALEKGTQEVCQVH